MPASARLDESERLLNMLAFEKRAVLPLKWLILAISSYFLIFLEHPYWVLPDVEPFLLFFLYFLFNLAQTYFFYFRRIEPGQIKPFVLVSYFVDLIFVTGLMYCDGRRMFGMEPHSDLYVFYFLVVLRGATVFSTARGRLGMNLLLSALFILAVWQMFDEPDYDPARRTEYGLKLALIWMVMLVSWFIVDIIYRQSVQLLGARERLLRSENLASVGQLSAGVAHEINNPIGIIKANCEYLLRLMPPDDQRREDIEAIHKEAGRVQAIVRELMDFSKPHGGERQKCSLRALNEETLKFLFHGGGDDAQAGRADAHADPVAGHGGTKIFSGGRGGDLEVSVACDDPLPAIWGDPNRIKQALLNVYLNARQAAGEQGRIEARLRAGPRRRTVEIAIADDGPGIDPKAVRHAFDPFFTTRPGGTGLGLAVTRHIVDAHGGDIAIERLAPRGTRVRMTFPAAD